MTEILYFQTIATFVFGELLFHADPKGEVPGERGEKTSWGF